jgi:DNA-binding XRE family transcriptional regulator
VRQLSETHLKQFGQNIICLRIRVGLTQEKLAEKVEISSRYFQSIEAGKRWPSLGVLLRLKVALECKWSDLFLNLE